MPATAISRLFARAAAQRGVATRAQALEARLTPAKVGRRLKEGEWVRLYRGVYRIGAVAAPLEWAAGAVLAAGPAAHLSHLSAARLWGWIGTDPTSPPEGPVHLVVEGVRVRSRAGLRIHESRPLDPAERGKRMGFPVTGAGRTMVDAAALLGLRDVERMVSRARRDAHISEEALRALPLRYRRRPGVAALRAVLQVEGGPALIRSEAEARFLQLVREAGLPAPSANVSIGPYEADFLWPEERVVVEVDGFGTHGIRARFEGDRRKDAWLSARGYIVIRTTWRQITKEAIRTVVEVAQALARASERRGGQGRPARGEVSPPSAAARRRSTDPG